MEYHAKRVLCSLPIIPKFAFYLAGMECMFYCDHKSLAPFFTTGMSSPMLDRWTVELQQFNIKSQHIQGKRNIVDVAISQLRTLVLYQEKDNEDVPLTTEDVIKNIIEEVDITEVIQKTPTYNIKNLKLRHSEEEATMRPVLQEQGERNENKAGPQLPTRQK